MFMKVHTSKYIDVRIRSKLVCEKQENYTPRVHLVSEQCDEAFSFSLQIQVHVEQLSIQSLVNLLFPLHPA